MSRQKKFGAALILIISFLLVKTLWWDDEPFWSYFTEARDRERAKMVGSTPTNRPPATKPAKITPVEIPTLLRELPRQALNITAAESLRLPANDPSIDFAGTVPPMPLSITPTYDLRHHLQLALVDASGKAVKNLESDVPTIAPRSPDYAKWASHVESWCDKEFAPALAAAGKPNPLQISNANVPADIEPLLLHIDPQNSFLAVNRLHQEIEKSGESPAMLSALVRGYANLGEATRYLYSAHSSVFFARSLIYAEKLVRQNPQLTLAHASRGYAYAVIGMPNDAQRELLKAKELAGNDELPSWAKLSQKLAQFQTRELFDASANENDAALASYFALLSVEHSGMQNLVINMSRLALKHNPGAMRIIMIMIDNSGVGFQDEATQQLTNAQMIMLSKLASDAGVPESIQHAAKDAAGKRFEPTNLDALFATMNKEPAGPAQLAPWSVYASISQDALFASGFRRLYYTGWMQHVDPTARLKKWREILNKHRFAPALVTFESMARPLDQKVPQELRRIGLDDLRRRMERLPEAVQTLNGKKDDPLWTQYYSYNSDQTPYEMARLLWAFGTPEADAIPVLGFSKGGVAKDLLTICPNHPSALADFIVNRWPEAKEKAADIERDMGAHPQVAFALARAYRSEKRYDDALRMLNQAIRVSPDHNVYEELAQVYQDQGNADKWLEVQERYLLTTEEFGLEHARTNEKIAYALMQMRRPERALKYAEASAESGSSWGMLVHAMCLTDMGRYAEAEEIQQSNQERYPGSFAWYRWCLTTGRGDIASAKKAADEYAPRAINTRGDPSARDLAWYLGNVGRLDEARKCWHNEFSTSADPFAAIEMAMIDLQEGNKEDAIDIMEKARYEEIGLPPEFVKMMGAVTPSTDKPRLAIYKAAADELMRCLGEPNALPARDERVKAILDAKDTPARGNAAYYLGKYCEMQGKNQDAIWWYQVAMDCGNWNFTNRPGAAAGLRRLGVELFK